MIILPHPWCNFCEFYLYNDQTLSEHLNKNHLSCHLCGDKHKYLFYHNYSSLERHFNMTHYMCQDANCRAACYVAFRTPEELTMHQVQVHQKQVEKQVQAQEFLLGFDHVQEKKVK